MVADDLVVAANTQRKMQTALLIVEQDASRERYMYNTDKTKTIVLNSKSSSDLKFNKLLGVSDKEAHLGIYRNHNKTNVDTIDARIKNARKAA